MKRITQNDGETDILPQYSPDGTKISYFTYKWENNQHTRRIRIANPDGSGEIVISDFRGTSKLGTICRERRGNRDT